MIGWVIYCVIAYLLMWIISTFLVGTTHKPDFSTKLVGVLLVVFAPLLKLVCLNAPDTSYTRNKELTPGETYWEIGENHPDFEDKFYGPGYINPAIKEHEDEFGVMIEKLEIMAEDIEGSGPVDEDVMDAIDALKKVLSKIEKLKA